MFRIRQIVMGYMLALISAGPIPLWIHHLTEHSCCSTETTSQPTCHDCAFCKHRSEKADKPEGNVDSRSNLVVTDSSSCDDCMVCYQLSQSSVATQFVELEHCSGLVPFVGTLSYKIDVVDSSNNLGPRGPPSLS